MAGVLRRHRRGPRERSGGVHRHSRTVLRGAAVARRWGGDGARLGRRTRAGRRSRARTGGVEFADLRRRHAGHHRRPAGRRTCADQSARRLGYRRRHPQPVRRLPASDGRRSRRSASPPSRSIWSPSSTATRRTPTPCWTSQAYRRAVGGAGVGAVGDRLRLPRNGCATTEFRCWRASAAAWRRSVTWCGGRCRWTRQSRLDVASGGRPAPT